MPSHRLRSCWLGLIAFMAIAAKAQSEANPCEGAPQLTQPILSSQRGEDGIGGTGFAPSVPSIPLVKRSGDGEEGIGGTGIVGTITGFGSICVNGLEIHYDNQTPTSENGSPSNAQQLALGQTVSVLTKPLANGFLAKEIRVLYEANGPIESINTQPNQLVVLGQTIQLPSTASGGMTTFKRGEVVAVSGSRLPDGTIMAWRIESRKEREQVSLIGVATVISPNLFKVGTQQVKLADGSQPINATKDIMVKGTLRDGILHAESIIENPRVSFRAPVDRLFIDGFARPIGAGKPNMDGMPFNAGNGGNPAENLRPQSISEKQDLSRQPARPEMSRPDSLRPDSARPDKLQRPDLLRPSGPRMGLRPLEMGPRR